MVFLVCEPDLLVLSDLRREVLDDLLSFFSLQAALSSERADLILEIAPQFFEHSADLLCGQSRSRLWDWL